MLHWERFFELATSKATREHMQVSKKPKEVLAQKFFSARVADLWNVLDDTTVAGNPEC